MTEKARIPVCHNHLSELFEAIQRGDIVTIEKLEHELTYEEECVACGYLLRARGSVRDALIHFLKEEGFLVEVVASESPFDHALFWGIRSLMFFSLFVVFFTAEKFAQQAFINARNFNFFSLSIIELIFVTFAALLVFIIIDDAFFD